MAENNERARRKLRDVHPFQGTSARRDVIRMKLVWIGVALGLAGAYGITRRLGSLLDGVKSSGPATFAVVAVVVVRVAAVATFVLAQRASAIAPSDALRHQ